MDSERSPDGVSQYEARVSSEISIYRDCVDVHNLPPIFHYWSNRYIRPTLERHGFTDPAGMFLKALENQCAKHIGETTNFLSVGSGNCELEIKIAAGLRASGYKDFIIECVDLNQSMLERGAEKAKAQGIAGNLEFTRADLNRWSAPHEYHAVIADQSLHHIVDLESLFGQIRQSLKTDGVFAISDMIGRNGHLRWPKALEIVRELWRKLPPSYRYNCRSGRYEAFFEDADCSTESFEGIRAQDIVSLLKEYFHFHFFLGFGNLIDPFVDRSFGPNFDPEAAWDREFIDHVHRRDEEEIAAGRLQPTHMLAMLGNQADATSAFGASVPPFTVSIPESPDAIGEPPKSGYDWGSWPHTAQVQLERTCRIMEESESRTKKLEAELERAIASAHRCEAEFQERTAWALRLDRQLRATELALFKQKEERIENEGELLRRTVWARKLEAELAERTAWALRLDSELAEQTQWALDMETELTAVTRQLSRRQQGLADYLRNALRLTERRLAVNVTRVRKLLG